MTDQTADAARISSRSRVPRYVPLFNVVARRMLRIGTPMGPNALVTVRGRRSGLPRTTPLAIVEHSGRRWIWAPFGEVDWVRNLRASGCAAVTVRRQTEEVRAIELDAAERVTFFRDVLVPIARSIPLGPWFIRTLLGADLDDPVVAAAGRPVFELHRTQGAPATLA